MRINIRDEGAGSWERGSPTSDLQVSSRKYAVTYLATAHGNCVGITKLVALGIAQTVK